MISINLIPGWSPEYMDVYQHMITGNTIVMCQDTFISLESLPLYDCFNIVISDAIGIGNQFQDHKNLLFLQSYDIMSLNELVNGEVYVVGDAILLNKFLISQAQVVERIYMRMPSGTSTPPFQVPSTFELQAIPYRKVGDACFLLYKKARRRHDEYHYLNLLQELLYKADKSDGISRPDRTGTGTHSLFGKQIRFNLENGIVPFITTKKLFFKGMFQELLWFLRGDTDAKKLSDEGCAVWNDNSTQAFLDARGLKHREFDVGPMYGHNLRAFGAPYMGCDHPAAQVNPVYGYKCGFDQLTNLVAGLKADPFSRRHLLTTFDPSIVDQCVLAPCHGIAIQFYVEGNNINRSSDELLSLSCQVYCRSSDCFLGLPWNIASYAVLTRIIAKKCGMLAKELILSLGDAHIYTNHVDQVRAQLSRSPMPFPHLIVADSVKDADWGDLKLEDFTVMGYISHAPIKAPMAI